MDRKTLLMVLVVGLVLIASVSAVYARQDEEECILEPSKELGVDAITGGFSYVISGGIGPILILIIGFILGMVISHLVWGGMF